MPNVRFEYQSGILPWSFDSAVLHGSWDAEGRSSDQWTSRPMVTTAAEDGCPAYTVSVDFPASEVDKGFSWYVELKQGGNSRHGVTEERNDRNAADTVCMFTLGAAGQEEIYRFNWSRALGAQKVLPQGSQKPAVQFSVWAPHAREIEVVMADLRPLHQAGSSIDPARSPALAPIPADQVAGGYVYDNGQGIIPNWGPFRLTRSTIPNIWQTDINDPALSDFSQFEHCPYMFRVTRDDGLVRYRTDLYSRCQVGFGSKKPQAGGWDGRTLDLDGMVSCSSVKDPDHVCRDYEEPVYPEQNWLSADDFWASQYTDAYAKRPTRVEDLVIYELHVGALGFGKPVNEPGSLKDAMALLDYLQDLGVNAIELLPMAEVGGGGGGWGYATSHYFAIEYAGGGRDKYKHFIRECHRRGIVVILDVVFNHYNPDADRAEWMYDSTADEKNIYYWYQGLPGDYTYFNAHVKSEQWGQGGYVDNMSTGWAPRFWDPMVRRMFVSSLLALTNEFQIDGFRFDQTTSMHAYNVLHADGTPVQDANSFGWKFLREAVRAVRLLKPDALIMAEDHSDDPGSVDALLRPNDQGGVGFNARWYADFCHHLNGTGDYGPNYARLLVAAGYGGDGPLAMDYFAGALNATGRGAVTYQESHDEAGNGSNTDRTIKVAVNGVLTATTRAVAEARVRLVNGLNFLSAGTPLFLFGEEVGAEKKYTYGAVLENREDLYGLRATTGANLFRYFAAIIRLRLTDGNGGLRSRNIEVAYVHDANRIIAFRRWEGGQNFLVIASFNNRPFDSPSYTLSSDKLGDENWREVFNSDAAIYGGANIGNYGQTLSARNHQFTCVLPANGLIVFART